MLTWCSLDAHLMLTWCSLLLMLTFWCSLFGDAHFSNTNPSVRKFNLGLRFLKKPGNFLSHYCHTGCTCACAGCTIIYITTWMTFNMRHDWIIWCMFGILIIPRFQLWILRFNNSPNWSQQITFSFFGRNWSVTRENFLFVWVWSLISSLSPIWDCYSTSYITLPSIWKFRGGRSANENGIFFRGSNG